MRTKMVTTHQFCNKVPFYILLATETAADAEKVSEALKPNFFDLFRPLPIARRTLNMCLQWFSVTMVYFGLSFASTRFEKPPRA